MKENDIAGILTSTRTIALVGASDKPDRPSYRVMKYLLDQGYTEINSPKAVVRQAFAFGMLEDEKAWVNLLTDRNLTSHVYDEQTAKEIFEHIEHTYLKLFDEVIAYMK